MSRCVFNNSLKRCFILILGVMLSSIFAQSLDTLRVGSFWQIRVLVKDSSSSDLNPVPQYNVEFNLLFTKNSLPADTSTFKLWSLRDKPIKYHASGDTFWTPSDSLHSDSAYGGALPGYRYFILTSTDSGLFSISIDDGVSPTKTFNKIVFYLPTIKYYDEQGNEITTGRNIGLQTGEYLKVTAKALRPDGTLDTTFTSTSGRQWLVPTLPTGSGIEFYSPDNQGLPLNQIDSVLMSKGVGTFFLKSDAPVNGSSFTMNYVTSSNSSIFRPKGSSTFPATLSIMYPDAPMLDSAVIVDSDGDGLGDKISGYFNMGVDKVPSSPLMSWANDSAMLPVATKGASIAWTAGATSIAVTVDEKSAPNGKTAQGDFGVTVTSKSGNQVPTTIQIKDRIGPVIQAVTLLPGRNGAPDTLIAVFNKPLDSSFTSGSALMLNGDVLNVSGKKLANGTWQFIPTDGTLKLTAGDSVWLAVNGGIKASDGNLPSSNNKPAVLTKAGTLPALSSAGNGFFDSNHDGKLDSIAITFSEPISQAQVDSMDLRFIWKDTAGNPIELHPNPKDLVWNSKNPDVVSWKFNADSLHIMPFLTSITDDTYGYGNVLNHWVVNGQTFADTVAIKMADRMPPVAELAQVWPESNNQAKGDSLMIRFSEPVDTSKISSLDFLGFLLGGDSTGFGVSNPTWSDSGRVFGARIAKNSPLATRANPGDSLQILAGAAALSDTLGNAMTTSGNPLMLVGDARVLVENSFKAGVKSRADIGTDAPLSSNGKPKPVSVTFWDRGTLVSDLPKGSLGVLLDVGQSTLGDYDSLNSTLSLVDSAIGMSWRLDVFTNLGGFVASSKGEIRCDDVGYSGNCFENRKQVYISWNLLADNGRKAGYGVYAAKLTVHVWGKKTTTKEKIYLWGVGPCDPLGKMLCRE